MCHKTNKQHYKSNTSVSQQCKCSTTLSAISVSVAMKKYMSVLWVRDNDCYYVSMGKYWY